jgi:hypothetical protein
MAELVVKWLELKQFEVWNFLGESFEKGNTRKYTKNRVARCGLMFWRN